MGEQQEKEYIIFADESLKNGPKYGNFYGGLIVGASQYERITKILNDLKESLNLHGELKWSKVTECYLEKYKKFMQAVFRHMKPGDIRMRVMFQKHTRRRNDLTSEQNDNEFGLLYYQFLKHAFGFRHARLTGEPVNLRFYLDVLPVGLEKRERFKGYLVALSKSHEWREAGLKLERENVVEVESHHHALLQAVDIVTGAMAFKLNHFHKERHPETGKKGKRTRAKESLYKFILAEIREIRPRFNIGISTGGWGEERWTMPYRHWDFFSKKREEAHLP